MQNEEQIWTPVNISIPIEISANPYLSITTKYLFGYIQNLDKKVKGCWMSNAHLGNLLFVGPQTISNSIADLKNLGYIRIEEFQPSKLSNFKERRIFENPEYKVMYRDLAISFYQNYDKMDSDALLKNLYGAINKIIDAYKLNYIKGKNIKEENKEEKNIEISTKVDISIVPTDDASFPDDESILYFDKDGNDYWLSPDEIQERKILDKSPDQPDKHPRKTYQLNSHSYLKKYYPDAELLFDFWNNQGKPLHRHKRETKIWIESIERISKALKEFSPDEIKAAMRLYLTMLKEPENFKLSANARFHCVGLNQFMEFSDYDRNQMRSDDIARMIPSWFDECIQGKEFIDKKYGKLIKDEFPVVTNAFKRIWEERGYNSDSKTPRGENNFRQASKALMDFLNENQRKLNFVGMGEHRPENVVKHVFDAINYSLNDDDEFEITTGWLCSRAMFNKRLPDYLKENGIYS